MDRVLDKESSSGEEYANDEDEEEEEEYDDDDQSAEDLEPQKRRSSAAKRKSVAILSKDKTESWGNYRNTIDNGPVPRKSSTIIRNRTISFCFVEHALTLNEIAFDVALKLQQQNQNRQFTIDYLDQENKIDFVNDTKMKEQLLLDTYPIQLTQNVCLIHFSFSRRISLIF